MKIQLAKNIYLQSLDTMKKILDLLGFKLDKRTKDFLYAKSQVMGATYNGLNKLFRKMEQEGLIIKCACGTNVRQGYQKCLCGGSGFINKDK